MRRLQPNEETIMIKDRWILVRSMALLVVMTLAGAAPGHADKGAAEKSRGLAKAERLVIFGDSLSDTGNKYAARGIANQPPYDQLNAAGVPTDPYQTDEGAYFSNGAVWIERVGDALGSFDSAKPAAGRWPHAGNYAWGGARAFAAVADDGNRHLGDQVAAYLAAVNHAVDPAALHVVFIGGNDVADAGAMLLGGATPPQALGRLFAAVASINANLHALVDAGARRILLLSVPDVGLVPAVPAAGKPILTCLAAAMNDSASLPSGCPPFALPNTLSDVAAGLESRGVAVTRVDVFAFTRGLAANPAAVGLTNIDDRCVTPNVPPFACASPNDFLFWDGLHPTKAVHRLLAAVVLNALGQ
jgi:phospholipase/lecithinase/hemolysin